ncbi:MAG: hypothetical protein ACI89T_001624 [Cognaticolwellia sp.]|jgi:hypothetical protein
MDVLVDLLPPSYTAKAEPLSKDSDQKRQKHHNKSSHFSLEFVEVKAKANDQSLVDTERRAGEERREQEINRGRWLESRISKDRRANTLTVFVKV